MQIKDVERMTRLTAKAIRLYEEKGLIAVTRGENAYRDYDEETVKRLHTIRYLRGAGVSIPDIRLYSDGVLTLRELLNKRRYEIRNASEEVRRQYELCERYLSNCEEPVAEEGEVLDESETAAFSGVCDSPCAVGLDIGTTTISATVIDLSNHRQVEVYNFPNESRIPTEDPACREQDAAWMLDKCTRLLDSILQQYPRTAAIGITGQQHGIVYVDENGFAVSPLYTWQDARSGALTENGISYAEELSHLTGYTVSVGYGFATYYTQKRTNALPPRAKSFCCIMDYIAMRLVGAKHPASHPTTAASLGVFDIGNQCFDADALFRIGMGDITPPVTVADDSIYGYYRGIPVAYAIGDNQAGVFGSLRDEERSILVNYGTGSQINAVVDTPVPLPSLEIRPYFFGKYLQNGSALCGGRAYALLERFFRSYLEAAGLPAKSQYDCMNRLALLASEDESSLAVDTRFAGSRRDPQVRGSIQMIDENNFTPQNLVGGVLKGMATELYGMFSDYLAEHPDGILVASGNAVRKNPAFRNILTATFSRPLCTLRYREETAFGAALYAAIVAGACDVASAKMCVMYTEE